MTSSHRSTSVIQSSGHLYITRLLDKTTEKRNAFIVKMAERYIACNVHYKPLPMMTAYKALGFDIKEVYRMKSCSIVMGMGEISEYMFS